MLPCLAVVGLAFIWLLYESDWMRVRLLVGCTKEPTKTIRLYQGSISLNVGLDEPICGWDWLLSHEHPIIENHIEIIAHNCKHNIHLCNNPSVDYGRIMKDICSTAFKANIRRKNGHKPNKRKARLTFNPNYKLATSKVK